MKSSRPHWCTKAYLKLVDQMGIQWQNRAHFFGVAARAMRQILVTTPARAAEERPE